MEIKTFHIKVILPFRGPSIVYQAVISPARVANELKAIQSRSAIKNPPKPKSFQAVKFIQKYSGLKELSYKKYLFIDLGVISLFFLTVEENTEIIL